MGLMLKYIYVIVIQVLVLQVVRGQTLDTKSKNDNVVPSPYGQLGLGDIELTTSTRHAALAQTGIALPYNGHINMLNPALTAYTRQNVIFDAGITVQNIGIRNSSQSQHNTGANFHYFNIAIPISSKFWGSFIGIAPHSNANGSFQDKKAVAGSSTDFISDRSRTLGGLSKFYMTHGFKLPKNFAVGINASYIFGNITHTDIFSVTGNENYSIYTSKEVYKLLELTFGLSYFKEIKPGYKLFIGSTASFSTDIGSKDSLLTTHSKYISSLQTFNPYYKNAAIGNENILIALPPKIGFGIAIEKASKYSISMDYTYTSWSNFVYYGNNGRVFTAAHRLSVGGEWIPNASALKGYFNRVAYRGGLFYHSTPYFLQNTKINEYGITAGAGFPLGKSMISTLNLSLQAGQRGTVANGLVSETFFRLFLGININDRWFVKYKLD